MTVRNCLSSRMNEVNLFRGIICTSFQFLAVVIIFYLKGKIISPSNSFIVGFSHNVLTIYFILDMILNYLVENRIESYVHHILVLIGILLSKSLLYNGLTPTLICLFETITSLRILSYYCSHETFLKSRIYVTAFVRIPLVIFTILFPFLKFVNFEDFTFTQKIPIIYWSFLMLFVLLFDVYLMSQYVDKLVQCAVKQHTDGSHATMHCTQYQICSTHTPDDDYTYENTYENTFETMVN